MNINDLTPEQKEKLEEYRQKWLAIGLSTERVDFEKVKQLVPELYTRNDLKPPQHILFASGPNDAMRLIKEHKIDDPDEILNNTFFANHEASWLSFYDFLSNYIDYKHLTPKLKILIEVAKFSGWVSLYENHAIIQDRPDILAFDENDRLHAETTPAIRFRDGYSIYAWHGVIIPDEWIENPESLTPEIALRHPNIEERRAACEILGWAKVLKDLNAKVIDEDGDPEIGTLVEVDLPELGKERFLKVLCGTGREFALPVPPDVGTALEANAWTYGLDPDDFNIEVRT